MQVIIPEKPKVALELIKAISPNFKFIETGKDKGDDGILRPVGYYWDETLKIAVAPSVGHILDLPEPKTQHANWHIADLPLNFETKQGYVIPPAFKNRHAMFANLLARADSVIHAGDVDTEGQALVDNILRYHQYQGKVYRLWAENETVDGFKKAMADLKDNSDFEYLGWQGVARAIGDKAAGYNLTRAVTLVEQSKGDKETYHVGRVKAPILGLVARRDKAHETHQATFFYAITGQIHTNLGDVEASFSPNENTSLSLDEKKRLVDKEQAEQLTARLNELERLLVLEVQTKGKKQNPPLPFNANTLQQESNKRLGLSPDKTMEIAQQLKDAGYISYHRTDCEYISQDDHIKLEPLINQIIQSRYAQIAQHLNASHQGRMVDDKVRSQMAHSAIMPLSIPPSTLSEDELNLWGLIAERFIANYANAYMYKESKLFLDADGQGEIVATSKVLVDLGFKHVTGHTQNDLTSPIDVSQFGALSSLPVTLQCSQQKTQPPSYYSVSTLLEDIATAGKFSKNPQIKEYFRSLIKSGGGRQIGGLGTSATIMSIYKELQKEGYLSVKGKTVTSTEKGRKLVGLLDDRLTYPDLTALWHMEQQKIKTKQDADSFVKDTYAKYILPLLDLILQNYIPPKTATCPKCQGTMEQKKGTSKQGNDYSIFTCIKCGFAVWGKRDNLDEADLDNPTKKN